MVRLEWSCRKRWSEIVGRLGLRVMSDNSLHSGGAGKDAEVLIFDE